MKQQQQQQHDQTQHQQPRASRVEMNVPVCVSVCCSSKAVLPETKKGSHTGSEVRGAATKERETIKILLRDFINGEPESPNPTGRPPDTGPLAPKIKKRGKKGKHGLAITAGPNGSGGVE